MLAIKDFVKLNKKKAILFLVFILIVLGGRIQSKLRISRCNLFEFFPFMEMWMVLELPLIIPFLIIEGFISELIIRITGKTIFLDLYSPIFIIAEILYFYFLACLAVFSFEYYGHRFSKFIWALIIVISLPIALLEATLHPLKFEACLRFFTFSPLWLLLSFVGIFPIVFFYIYLLFALAVFGYNKLTKRNFE